VAGPVSRVAVTNDDAVIGAPMRVATATSSWPMVQGVTRNLMANDLLAYITARGTITPTTDGRIDDVARPDA
jgi:hypothetical protein